MHTPARHASHLHLELHARAHARRYGHLQLPPVGGLYDERGAWPQVLRAGDLHQGRLRHRHSWRDGCGLRRHLWRDEAELAHHRLRHRLRRHRGNLARTPALGRAGLLAHGVAAGADHGAREQQGDAPEGPHDDPDHSHGEERAGEADAARDATQDRVHHPLDEVLQVPSDARDHVRDAPERLGHGRERRQYAVNAHPGQHAEHNPQEDHHGAVGRVQVRYGLVLGHAALRQRLPGLSRAAPGRGRVLRRRLSAAFHVGEHRHGFGVVLREAEPHAADRWAVLRAAARGRASRRSGHGWHENVGSRLPSRGQLPHEAMVENERLSTVLHRCLDLLGILSVRSEEAVRDALQPLVQLHARARLSGIGGGIGYDWEHLRCPLHRVRALRDLLVLSMHDLCGFRAAFLALSKFCDHLSRNRAEPNVMKRLLVVLIELAATLQKVLRCKDTKGCLVQRAGEEYKVIVQARTVARHVFSLARREHDALLLAHIVVLIPAYHVQADGKHHQPDAHRATRIPELAAWPPLHASLDVGPTHHC
mmetsp:Transcript_3741/g.10541  ORF Transcript_3741/g.10541 Transcript_3741/m.10541 type:complete len:535 (+) Transcript_3741:175-1779(+)